MTTWVLIMWFSANGNYAYIPVTVENYSSREFCVVAGEQFLEQARGYLRPKFACVEKK